MNKVILMGRLTKDPEVRYSQGSNGTAVGRYSIAVNRSYRRDGEPDADFFNIVAFGNRGEFAGKYFKKGMMVAVVGELRNGSYTDRDGNKRYTTDVIVTEQYFAESRSSSESRGSYQQSAQPQPVQQQNYQQQAPVQQNYQQPVSQDFAPAGAGYPAQPVQQQAQPPVQQAPADGFMPIDTDIEGDEDLPF
ncbi:MAG: single-stranded DNA-binding protein [Firmicutes bacterium]|nr:single-stranded DNA-binding protein [Bacillota bacterium]